MRKGFTLVELSIVLVIIGLLIGGILAAQSMIDTAKVSAQVRQIGQFDAMVLNFKSKFNFLPGDAPAFGGDGDGVLEITAASGYDSATSIFACEIANFWNNIDPQQYPGNSVCLAVGTKIHTSGPLKNAPSSKLGTENSSVIASAISTNGGYADTVNPANYYAILSGSQGQVLSGYGDYHFMPTTSANSAVKSVDLLALDRKIDNGIANSGIVLSGSIADFGGYGVGGIVASPLPTCSVGPNYDLSHDSNECTPLIRIGGSVDLPQ